MDLNVVEPSMLFWCIIHLPLIFEFSISRFYCNNLKSNYHKVQKPIISLQFFEQNSQLFISTVSFGESPRNLSQDWRSIKLDSVQTHTYCDPTTASKSIQFKLCRSSKEERPMH